jgi:intracellular sulfur oxidation DsrE/DsrF family protein
MKFSDEMISAYADGELQGSEKTEFENELENDEQLQQTLNDLCALKVQLRQTYQNVRPPASPQYSRGNYRVAVYAMFLMLAFSVGWFSSDSMHTQHEVMAQAESMSPGMQVIAQQPGKYILHISVRDKKKFKQTLDQAEALMANYRNTDQGIELEIIANAGGLDLFREDVSPYAQRVKQLRQRYPNIKFVACSNAIERLREQGIEPKLINSVHQGATAIDQVVKRIHQGWSYIKI